MLALTVLFLAGPQIAMPDHASEPARFVVLERSLRPPVDARGRPWRVEVLRSDAAGPEEVVASANAHRDGRWRHAKVPAGSPIRLRVRTEDGDVWWISPLPFAPEGDGQEGAIDLGMVPVRGVARVGKQPLAGEVVFAREEGSVIHLVSNVEGELEGALPDTGPWTARVRSSAAAFDRSLEVEVPDPEPDAPSFVDIHFRDPALRGVVVDPKGNPVAGFTLAIREEGASTDTLEKFEGSTFRYERVGPGVYRFRVRAPWKSSPTYRIRIPDDDDPDFVKAVLEPRKEFRGRVVSTAGTPLPGGWGLVNPDGSEGWSRDLVLPRGPLAEFHANLPERAARACIVLHPPGHAVRITTWPMTEEPHQFVVSAIGGVLVLDYPRLPDRVTVLVKDECFDFPASLVSRSGVDDRGSYARVVSPPMEPGTYSLCSASTAELAAFRGNLAALPTCVHGALAPGGRLDLNLLER